MPISAGAGALLSPIVGAGAGALFGGGGGAQAQVPGDLRGMRQQNIDLLGQLLGFGGGGQRGPLGQWAGQGGWRGGLARVAGAGQGTNPYAGMDPAQRLDQFFGGLTSPLQRQATQGMSQYLNQPAPETQAYNQSLPALQGILNQNSGQGILDALQPHFDRNLASANQQGGRFGSGNAILRSRAVDDYNLLGNQALQQGQQNQLQAGNIIGMLAGQAGQNPFSRLMGAQQAGDTEPARRIAILMNLLGTSQSATLGQPTSISPSGGQQGLQAGFGIAQLMPFLQQSGLFGGGGSARGTNFSGGGSYG